MKNENEERERWSLPSFSFFVLVLRSDPAQIPHQQQVLQVRRDRREVLERLDRLLSPLGVPRAQRRREDLLEQGRLTVRRGAEDAKVAPADAEARQLGDRADDLLLGVVVEDV